MGTLLLLDVEMAAPVITMPRCSDSRDALELDLGHLQLRNALSWRGGAGAGDRKVAHDRGSCVWPDPAPCI